MKYGMSSAMIYRVASISAPIVCLLIASAISTYETVRLHAIDSEIEKTKKDNAAAQKLIIDVQKFGEGGLLAVASDSRQEQLSFVDQLRTTAEAGHVRLTQWSPASAKAIGVPDDLDEAGKDAIKKVLPVANSVGITGTFGQIRGFLNSLVAQDRLVVLSDMKWVRAAAPPATAIEFTITRYVETGGATTAKKPQ